MKNIFLLLLNLLLAYHNFAQTSIPIEYTYDNAGNRICRKVVDLDGLMQMRSKGATADSAYFADNLQSLHISISPNPTYGIINVVTDAPPNGSPVLVNVFESNGQLSKKLSFADERFSIDLSSHPAGFYIIEIVANGERTTWKVVKH